MSRRKYESIKGSFPCRICGIIYPYSDLRDACEGREYFRDGNEDLDAFMDGREPGQKLSKFDLAFLAKKEVLYDPFAAEVGEKVLRTQYHGNDWAQPPNKPGLFLTYTWETVREKRIIPSHGFLYGGRNNGKHVVGYKIDQPHPEIDKLIGERWDIDPMSGVSGAVGWALGPYHYWSKGCVEAEGKTWPNYVIDMCEGERNNELLKKKKAEGYEVYIYE